MQLANEVRKRKQLRLPWWGVLCWMIACALILWPFVHFGRFDLGPPTLYSIGMLGAAIAMRWKLRRHVWFWITMAVIAALHVPLILLIHWTTKWVPAFVTTPFAMADLFVILVILSVVGKFMERPKTSAR